MQKLHIGRRDFHLHHEVGSRKTEQHQQVVFAKQCGIDDQLALGVVQDRQRKAGFTEAVDQFAYDVAALVAKEQPGQDLNLQIGTQWRIAQALSEGALHQGCVALQVVKGQAQAEVLQQPCQNFLHAGMGRVVGTVGRTRLGLAVFDVLGTDSGSDEDEVVLKVAAVQNLGRDRVEKCLSQFRLMVIDQQADVMQLDLLPDVHGLFASFEFALQALGAFTHL